MLIEVYSITKTLYILNKNEGMSLNIIFNSPKLRKTSGFYLNTNSYSFITLILI